ncbi:MAG: sugar ABC transporter ATP-binding protein [Firmicutes bacterium]|nr:sugar ABC transporter ATP-binding protein [Bacillota bacterium]
MELLEVRQVSKAFPGVYALKKVDFVLKAGEVHALVGENGAGKSTLIKILSGVHRADTGAVFLEGKPIEFNNPSAARALGIGTIFQDFELANNLTVAENISLGRLPRRRGAVDWNAVRARAKEVLGALQVPLDPMAMAGGLGVGEQQIVEIARVMSQEVKVLIMDEPTSSLTSEEVDRLFEIMRKLTDREVGIIYISHRLEEVFRVSDRISVLRDGQMIGTYVTREVEPAAIISAMLGGRKHAAQHKERQISGDVVLNVENLSGPLLREPISFQLHRGEILGLAGLLGSGRSEILGTLFGMGGPTTGTVQVEGTDVNLSSPQQAVAAGMALVPEDRHREGIFPNLSVRENMVIPNLIRLTRGGLISPSREKRFVHENIAAFSVKTAGPETPITNLSGGNQQKVVFAKWCGTRPRILLLDEPTRGVDVGAKAELYAIVNRLVEKGLSVILASSELKELLDVCDRILVVRNGQIITEVPRDHFDYTNITAMMMGAK